MNILRTMLTSTSSRLVPVLVVITSFMGCARDNLDETIVYLKPGSPVAYVHFQVSAGSAYDPPGREGLAYYTAQLLRRGCETLTRDMINDSLDLMAASIDINVDREMVVISGRCLAEDFDRFAHLFAEVLAAPTFPASEADKLRAEQLDAIDGLRRDDNTLAFESLQGFLYRDHPYGHPVEGYTETVGALSNATADSFYQATYRQENHVLGVAGGVTEQQVRNLSSALKDLSPGMPTPPALPAQILTGRHIYLIEKENRAQAQLRCGKPFAVTRASSDFMPHYLTMTALGRHRESIGRLYHEIRSERGLAYGAYAYAEHFEPSGWSKLARPGLMRHQQYISTWTYPKSINAEFCIREMMYQLEDLAQGGLTADELEMARNFEINHFPFEIETPDRYLGFRADEHFYGNPTYVDSFEVNARSVTLDNAHRIAQGLDPANLVVVAVVSDGEKFKQELLDKKCPLEYPSGKNAGEMAAADATIKSWALNLKPDNIHIVRADEMFVGAAEGL